MFGHRLDPRTLKTHPTNTNVYFYICICYASTHVSQPTNPETTPDAKTKQKHELLYIFSSVYCCTSRRG